MSAPPDSGVAREVQQFLSRVQSKSTLGIGLEEALGGEPPDEVALSLRTILTRPTWHDVVAAWSFQMVDHEECTFVDRLWAYGLLEDDPRIAAQLLGMGSPYAEFLDSVIASRASLTVRKMARFQAVLRSGDPDVGVDYVRWVIDEEGSDGAADADLASHVGGKRELLEQYLVGRLFVPHLYPAIPITAHRLEAYGGPEVVGPLEASLGRMADSIRARRHVQEIIERIVLSRNALESRGSLCDRQTE